MPAKLNIKESFEEIIDKMMLDPVTDDGLLLEEVEGSIYMLEQLFAAVQMRCSQKNLDTKYAKTYDRFSKYFHFPEFSQLRAKLSDFAIKLFGFLVQYDLI